MIVKDLITVPLWISEINLLDVTMHEIGHSLGLRHSTESRSIMREAVENSHHSGQLPQLSADDVAAIQNIYGKKPEKTHNTRDSMYILFRLLFR